MIAETKIIDLDNNKEAEEIITGQLKSMIAEIIQACVDAEEDSGFMQRAMQTALDTMFTEIHDTGALVYASSKRLLGYTASVTFQSEDEIKIHLEPVYFDPSAKVN